MKKFRIMYSGIHLGNLMRETRETIVDAANADEATRKVAATCDQCRIIGVREQENPLSLSLL